MSSELVLLIIVVVVVMTAVAVYIIARRPTPDVREVVDTFNDLSRRVRELEVDNAADRGVIRSLEDRVHKLLRVVSRMAEGIQSLTGQLNRLGEQPDWIAPYDVQGWLSDDDKPEMTYGHIKLQLLGMINQYFSPEELIHGLMWSLDIEYDQIAGNTKLAKIQDFIGYCERHGLLAKLIENCKKQRPHVEWPHQ